MRHVALLRLLLVSFLLYVAWPYIPEASSQVGRVFWGIWLVLFMLSFGANLASLLQMMRPVDMKQQQHDQQRTFNR